MFGPAITRTTNTATTKIAGVEKERCAFCGALNPVDAEWCGQCLRRFPPPEISVDPIESAAGILTGETLEAPTSAESKSVGETAAEEGRRVRPAAHGAFTVTETGITWTCAQCGAKNPLEASLCSVCGTTFAETMSPTPPRPRRDPNMAALLSLFLPGAGHAYVGLWAQAASRAVISVWVIFVVAVSLFARGQANSTLMAVVFGAVAVALWALGAHDAYREARNESRLVLLKGKTFFWLVLGLLMLLFVMMVVTGFQVQAS
jgi:ribosomal protein L40E